MGYLTIRKKLGLLAPTCIAEVPLSPYSMLPSHPQFLPTTKRGIRILPASCGGLSWIAIFRTAINMPWNPRHEKPRFFLQETDQNYLQMESNGSVEFVGWETCITHPPCIIFVWNGVHHVNPLGNQDGPFSNLQLLAVISHFCNNPSIIIYLKPMPSIIRTGKPASTMNDMQQVNCLCFCNIL